MNIPILKLTVCLFLLTAIPSFASDGYHGWTPRAGDHVLFTKELPPVGTETPEKAILSFWCSQKHWEKQQRIAQDEQLFKVSFHDAVKLAKTKKSSEDYQVNSTERILVSDPQGSTFRYFYYISLSSPNGSEQAGYVILSDGSICTPVVQLLPLKGDS